VKPAARAWATRGDVSSVRAEAWPRPPRSTRRASTPYRPPERDGFAAPVAGGLAEAVYLPSAPFAAPEGAQAGCVGRSVPDCFTFAVSTPAARTRQFSTPVATRASPRQCTYRPRRSPLPKELKLAAWDGPCPTESALQRPFARARTFPTPVAGGLAKAVYLPSAPFAAPEGAQVGCVGRSVPD